MKVDLLYRDSANYKTSFTVEVPKGMELEIQEGKEFEIEAFNINPRQMWDYAGGYNSEFDHTYVTVTNENSDSEVDLFVLKDGKRDCSINLEMVLIILSDNFMGYIHPKLFNGYPDAINCIFQASKEALKDINRTLNKYQIEGCIPKGVEPKEYGLPDWVVSWDHIVLHFGAKAICKHPNVEGLEPETMKHRYSPEVSLPKAEDIVLNAQYDSEAGWKWWCDELHKEFTLDEIDHLKEQAIERIAEMTAEGYSSGELHATIVRGNKEYNVQGWWNA